MSMISGPMRITADSSAGLSRLTAIAVVVNTEKGVFEPSYCHCSAHAGRNAIEIPLGTGPWRRLVSSTVEPAACPAICTLEFVVYRRGRESRRRGAEGREQAVDPQRIAGRGHGQGDRAGVDRKIGRDRSGGGGSAIAGEIVVRDRPVVDGLKSEFTLPAPVDTIDPHKLVEISRTEPVFVLESPVASRITVVPEKPQFVLAVHLPRAMMCCPTATEL